MKTSGISLGFFNAPFLCLFWLRAEHSVDSVRLSAPEVVTGAYGGSLTVPCQYGHKYREYTKYWCRGPIYELCDIVVKTPRVRSSDRSSIADDKIAGVFTVTMSSLRESDEDTYWCVLARPGRNIYTGVRIHVSQPAIRTTTPTTILERYEMSWWATLRWIVFILMLCCLVSTHIAVWRIKIARKKRQQPQVQYECQATPEL
ncbi:CMRF35-like molecule 1 isoform X2 [Gymnodraco acuticeps]|uniref:CMRF35-like molecule 1 isoform X2 n=1 Tax=Gymnodraco acuticeps TaxID=8218 RepID=A0A6P8TRP5_GYMAC|nr:CMRF35-like molecule 1 isoform X2 [Gymnodraco acuticeps]